MPLLAGRTLVQRFGRFKTFLLLLRLP